MYISVTQPNYLTSLKFFFIYFQEKSIALATFDKFPYTTGNNTLDHILQILTKIIIQRTMLYRLAYLTMLRLLLLPAKRQKLRPPEKI